MNSEIIRLALITSEGSSNSLNTSIIHMTHDVLTDYGDQGLDLDGIASSIMDTYNIQFTADEIDNALKKKRSKHIAFDDGKYYVSVQKANEILNEREKLDLKTCLEEFIDANPELDIQFEILSDLINKHIYSAYNNNRNSLLRLFNLNEVDNDSLSEVKFTNNEVDIINAFVKWPNGNKNRILFALISSGYDYCMLTSRKESRSLKNVMKGKRFFLDANVIFRLMGINQLERKVVIESFIERCKKEGIKILFTNFTKQEVFESITSHVNSIQRLLRKHTPLLPDVIKSDHAVNLDYYTVFYNWCRTNDYKDYEGFRDYLGQLFFDATKSFQMITIPSYKTGPNANRFESYTKDFQLVKANKGKRYNIDGIECDVNNFMYLEEDRTKKQYQSIWQANDYIITADGVYCDWAKDKLPAVPVAFLPSVWHSIILKYSGRAKDSDYEAFCLFLSRRHSHKLESDLRLDKIIQKVLTLPESTEIKEKLLIDIQNKLSAEYKDIDDIDEIVEMSGKGLIEDSINSKISQIEATKKDELAQIELSFSKKMDDALNAKMDSFYHTQAENEARDIIEKKKKRLKRIYNGLNITNIVIVVALAVFAVIQFSQGNDMTGIVSLVVTVVPTLITQLIKFLGIKEKIVSLEKPEKIKEITDQCMERYKIRK